MAPAIGGKIRVSMIPPARWSNYHVYPPAGGLAHDLQTDSEMALHS